MKIIDSFWQDACLSMKMLRRNSAFAAAAVFTLALGIGINTTVFTVINSLFLSPLPYSHSDQLVVVQHAPAVVVSAQTSSTEILNWAPRVRCFQSLTAYDSVFSGANLTGGFQPERVTMTAVLPNFFPTLGVSVVFGTGFPAGGQVRPGEKLAIISYRLWLGQFGATRRIIGRRITLNGLTYTIQGVARPGFSFPSETDVWITFTFRSEPKTGMIVFTDAIIIGRLRSGVSLAQAQGEMHVFSDLLQRMGRPHLPLIRIVALTGFDAMPFRKTLLVVFFAAWLVLLVASISVGNLTFSRVTNRAQELSVRVALGAGRFRLFEQVITESVWVAIIGGLFGFLLALLGVVAVRKIGMIFLPHMETLHADVRVFAFAIGISILSGTVAGLPPAMRAAFRSPQGGLNEHDEFQRATLRHGIVRRGLLCLQVASSMIVIIIAGVLVRSFVSVLQVSPGYNPENVLTASIWPAGRLYTKDDQFYTELLDRMVSIPGVEAVGATSFLPFAGGSGAHLRFSIGHGNPSSDPTDAPIFSSVTRDYFRAMRINVLEGRNFTASEMQRRAKPVAMVSISFARRYWPHESAIGKSITLAEKDWEITGVVTDVKSFNLEDTKGSAQVYLAFPSSPLALDTIVIRSHSDLESLAIVLQTAVVGIDANLPVYNIRTMKGRLSDSLALRKMTLLLLGMMAVTALFLMGTGVVGMSSESVAMRMREVGIRMALGAEPRKLCWMIMRQTVQPILIGVALGVSGILALSRLLTHFLTQIDVIDPITVVAMGLLAMMLAALAAYLPARRAVCMNPAATLRFN